MLNGKWLKRFQEAAQEKDVLKTCNKFSPNLSSLKDFMVPPDQISQNVDSEMPKSNYLKKKYN